MKFSLWYLCLLILVSGCTSSNIEKSKRKLRQEVIDTETTFAKTMADRNFNNFKEFISNEAIFFDDDSQLKGKTKILEAWERYFKGEIALFSWKPRQVDVLPSGSLAHSSGPVYDAEGNQIGYFNSVWRLEGNKWKIIFDKGYSFCKNE